MIGCRDGFRRVIKRDDLSALMLEATEKYLSAYSDRAKGWKNRKKLENLQWHRRKVEGKLIALRAAKTEVEDVGEQVGEEGGDSRSARGAVVQEEVVGRDEGAPAAEE